jgi:hypothetical protein
VGSTPEGLAPCPELPAAEPVPLSVRLRRGLPDDVADRAVACLGTAPAAG